MAQLRDVLTTAGFTDVQTWIQSGNILLKSDLPAREISKNIHELIKEHIGADLPVVVRTPQQIRKMMLDNPFRTEGRTHELFFVSFENKPAAERTAVVLAQDFSPGKLAIMGHSAYLFAPEGAPLSRLDNNYLEKKLGVKATTRNFNTIAKMLELSERDEK